MKTAALALLLATLSACARHVVIEPNDVAARNDPAWVVAREPGRQSGAPK